MPLFIGAKIEGVQKVSELLKDVDRKLNDFTEPLKEANNFMHKEIQSNFGNQGTQMKKPWQKLSPQYKKQKTKKYPGKGILEASGKMKRSFRSKVDKKKAIISNPTDYFGAHQTNKRSKLKNLPRRVMLNITKEQNFKIVKIFHKFIHKVTNG